MALCPNCRVELGDDARHCPLCRAPIRGDQTPQGARPAYPEQVIDPEDLDGLTSAEKRKIFLELFTVCSAIAAIAVTVIDLLLDGRPSWSPYALSAIAMLWLLVCMPLILAGRPWLVFSVLGPSSLAFLFLIDILDGRADWFLALGLPLGIIGEGAIVACGTLVAVSRRKGINVIAIALAGSALACAGIELVLSLRFAGRPELSWSAIVLAAGLPSSGFLFYMHYRIVNRASLRKLFHL
jgi:hypothetical protein